MDCVRHSAAERAVIPPMKRTVVTISWNIIIAGLKIMDHDDFSSNDILNTRFISQTTEELRQMTKNIT